MNHSASSMDTFQACPRKYYIKYVERRSEPGTSNTEIGKAVHAALEQWPNQEPNWSALDPLQGLDYAMAAGMVSKVSDNPPDWKVLASELRFEIETPTHGKFVGSIDAIIEQNGRIYVLERKTSSLDADQLLDMKKFDRQTSLYILAARHLGYSPEGVMMDIIKRPNIRQKKDETHVQFTQRAHHATEVRREVLYKTEQDLDAFERDAEEVVDLIQLGKFPRNPSACFNFNRKCTFYSECQNGPIVKPSSTP